MAIDTLLVLALTLGISIYALRRLRARQALVVPPTASEGTPPEDTRPRRGNAQVTGAELTTVGLTLLVAYVGWHQATWMAQAIIPSTSGWTDAAFATLTALLPPSAGGSLGRRRGKNRGRTGIDLWRSTALGVALGFLALYAVSLGFTLLLVSVLSHSAS